MREIFLGKPWHWGMVMTVAAVLWWAGASKAHVIHFNTFLVALAVGSFAVILLILRTHKPGERVTREALLPEDVEDAEDKQEDVRS
ncbi:MAG: hypothetical protein HKN05_16815 [Rhizobiales bacterium]|nr:hypothetical protein [Hyphomicrobiales bacterium]